MGQQQQANCNKTPSANKEILNPKNALEPEDDEWRIIKEKLVQFDSVNSAKYIASFEEEGVKTFEYLKKIPSLRDLKELMPKSEMGTRLDMWEFIESLRSSVPTCQVAKHKEKLPLLEEESVSSVDLDFEK